MTPFDPCPLTRVVDLAQPLTPDMPLYPGTPAPEFPLAHTIERDGFNQRNITICSHVGTHLDAPAHLLEGGRTLDEFPPDHFFGPGLKIDCSHAQGAKITPEHLVLWERALQQSQFLLLETGWSRWWGRPEYFSGFPTLSIEAAEMLGRFPLKAVGVDAISVDPMDAVNLPVHHSLLGRAILIVENLTNLNRLPESGFMVCAFPWNMQGADGCPVRAVALLPEEGART